MGLDPLLNRSGRFTCATGDCGSSTVECSGAGAAPPTTLAEFTLNGSGNLDFYDVSLIDGYNLPMLVVPQGGSGSNCSSTGCLVDLNRLCLSVLKEVKLDDEEVACRSACEALWSPEYCCSGEYGNPNTCKPSSYSQLFKNACPGAYSYVYDDATSNFTCANSNYAITFYHSMASQKSGENSSQAALPLINNTMFFLSGGEGSSGAQLVVRPSSIGFILAIAVGIRWWMMSWAH